MVRDLDGGASRVSWCPSGLPRPDGQGRLAEVVGISACRGYH